MPAYQTDERRPSGYSNPQPAERRKSSMRGGPPVSFFNTRWGRDEASGITSQDRERSRSCTAVSNNGSYRSQGLHPTAGKHTGPSQAGKYYYHQLTDVTGSPPTRYLAPEQAAASNGQPSREYKGVHGAKESLELRTGQVQTHNTAYTANRPYAPQPQSAHLFDASRPRYVQCYRPRYDADYPGHPLQRYQGHPRRPTWL
ncbi:MAG: hypothetical protein M1820_005550 [Bogoriella megaspora]|nr:MAG: hypothetical protein M1820_005550 [Bogoriella megaspora]